MALIALGVITLGYFIAIFSVEAAWQLQAVNRGYAVTVLWAFGVRIGHVIAVLEGLHHVIKAIYLSVL